VKVSTGKPYPLGTSVSSIGTNFALFSAHAEKVELCLFDQSGTRETARIPLPCRTNDVWHGLIHDIKEGDRYGYRVYGPYDPESGHRFNHHKLLLDPYARRLHGELIDSAENLGYVQGHPDADLSFDTRDNAHNIPKCVVTVDDFNWQNDRFPDHALTDTVIYEAHVKGLTKQFPRLRQQRRGTYSAIANSRVIEYLKSLGITALELLPVHTFVDDSFLQDRGLTNYWGYNSLCFFAPDARYSEVDPLQEFRKMVKALHAADIEVILDVVYNHTAEGNELGPTLCYRGIDNASYYRLEENPRYYSNHSGCGNTLRAAHPRVVQLILDSLRFWTNAMHVDGFRFDLATVLARRGMGYDKNSGFFDAIMQDPTLVHSKLIAEPWDCGLGGYQLGNFPPRFSEWNDQYRDTVRKFWAGEAGQLQQLSKAIHGSSEVFEWQRRGPLAGVNFITAHDGYTLFDLVSYESKHNELNGEDNRDGHSANYSKNYGHEGPTDDDDINNFRNLQRRNLMATLLLSQGIPMILSGDELAHTQDGNNNAYCQDNELTWIDWSQQHKDSEQLDFVKKLICLRRKFPVLRQRQYIHGLHKSRSSDFRDINWLNRSAEAMTDDDWHDHDNRFVALLLCGDAGVTDYPDAADQMRHSPLETINAEASVLIIINGSNDDVEFALPDMKRQWHLDLTTTEPAQERSQLNEVFVARANSVSFCSVD